MKTMRYSSILVSGLFLLGMAACESEDALVAEPDTLTECFAPDPDANDEVSAMQRKFYKEEGNYLLFTDTLRHEPLGLDSNGDMQYFTELLDLGYTLGNTSSVQAKSYTYGYLETISEKEEAVAFIKEYVLVHLPAGLRPFSWLLTTSIMDNSTYESLDALSGQRGIAVAVGYALADMTEEEKSVLAASVLSATLSASLSTKTTEMAPFYKFCQSLYHSYFNLVDYTDEENMQKLKEFGFITPYVTWGIELMGVCPTSEQDVTSFIKLVMGYTQAEIAEMYAGYPIVIEKAQVMGNLIKELGYID